MVCSRFGGEVRWVLSPVTEVLLGEILAHLAYFSAVTTINTEDPLQITEIICVGNYIGYVT